MQKRTRKDTNRRTQRTGPLLVKVFRSTLCALQAFATRLLAWLNAQAQEFRIIFCYFLLSNIFVFPLF